jgi:hypothetical protein
MQGHDPHSKGTSNLARHVANLKLISRLLGHELHAQGSAKTVTLSRDGVLEIQTTLDLFIEEVSRQGGQLGSANGVAAPETRLVASARN